MCVVDSVTARHPCRLLVVSWRQAEVEIQQRHATNAWAGPVPDTRPRMWEPPGNAFVGRLESRQFLDRPRTHLDFPRARHGWYHCETGGPCLRDGSSSTDGEMERRRFTDALGAAGCSTRTRNCHWKEQELNLRESAEAALPQSLLAGLGRLLQVPGQGIQRCSLPIGRIALFFPFAKRQGGRSPPTQQQTWKRQSTVGSQRVPHPLAAAVATASAIGTEVGP